MKTLPRWFALAALVAVFAVSSQAKVMVGRITPEIMGVNVNGLTFDIKAHRLQDGMIHFVILITSEKASTLKDTAESHTGAALEIKPKDAYWEGSGLPLGTLSLKRESEKSVSCAIIVPEKYLDDPTLQFVFWKAYAPQGQEMFMFGGAGDNYYIELRDFYKPVPVAPNRAWITSAELGACLALAFYLLWRVRRNHATKALPVPA